MVRPVFAETPHLAWEVVQESKGYGTSFRLEVIARIHDHRDAERFAAMMRKQYPKQGYSVQQAPGKKAKGRSEYRRNP